MSSILGLSEPDPIPVAEPPVPSIRRPFIRRLSAALLSSIVPGTGQFLLGQIRAGAFFLAGFVAVLMLFWPVRLPGSYVGLLLCMLALAGFSIAAAWHALRSPEDRDQPSSGWWLLLFILIAYVSSRVDANLAGRLAGFRPFLIPVSSMERTLVIGDRLVADMRYYHSNRPHLGDVVIFNHQNVIAVKRVIAVAGDTILGRNGLVYLNGNLLEERYVQHLNAMGGPIYAGAINDFGPITVPPGQLFVMGDNRDVSFDSRWRQYGPVYLGDLVGKPLYISRSPYRRRIGTAVR
jgi:signal peptidase I